MDSHIVPRAFFNVDADQPSRLLSNRAGSFPRRSRIGVYDQIVCEPCERSFSDYDHYACQVLLQGRLACETVRHRGEPLAYVIPNVDYRLLKLFVIATIWRASVARHRFYARVRLGPLEDRARDLLRVGDPGSMDDFGVWWSRFDLDWEPGVMDPFRERWGAARISAYRFYLGRTLAYIKSDSRPVPDEFRDFALRPGAPLVLIARNFQQSKDRLAMLAVVKRHARRG